MYIFEPMRFVLILFIVLTSPLLAQDINTDLHPLKPRSIGPAGMSGRVTSVTAFRSNPNLIVAGTASGGIWKSTNGGLTWEAIGNKLETGSIGAIAFQPDNADVIYAGTGEGNPRNSHNSGKGIYKTEDGGRTWKLLGLETTKTIHRIIVDPKSTQTLYAAAMGSIWGPGKDRGVYKSTDGGATWAPVLQVNETTGCAELVMDPSNPNKLFACMWEYQRKPYFFNSGGKGSGIYMTTNGGKTWTKLGTANGLPAGEIGRCGIAIAPSNSNKVYCIVESSKHGLYSSEDGGYKWSLKSESAMIGNRPFYYNEIYVNPKNENHLYSLWSQVTHSIDGGKSWSTLLDWNHVHPDHHAMYIHPDYPDFMINGNDGGLNISRDGGKTWRYIENLPVGQFYHIAVDNEIPYNIYGGLQDNGSWVGPGYTFTEGGIRNSDWKEVLFGDGFDVVPLPDNSKKGYAMYQGGNVYLWDLTTGKTQGIKPVHPERKYLRFNWNAGIAVHKASPKTVFFGSQFLHKSYDCGKSWSIISPDLTTNDTSKLHQDKSGGLTIDATNAENYCTIISIAPTPEDTNIIWVGTDDGNLQLTKDGGKSWTLMNSKLPGLPKNGWIPMIYNAARAGETWVVVNNYRQNDWEPYLYRTLDYGATWKRMADGNKVKGHCLSVLADPIEKNLVWLGTDFGLWVSTDAGANWTKWTNGMPSVPVQDLAIQERESDLVIGTFGQGIFVFDNITPFRKYAAGVKPRQKPLQILAGNHAYLANYSRPTGERFGADAMYEGENKPAGVRITCFAEANKNSKTQQWEKTEIQVIVKNESGKTVRNFGYFADSTGIYHIGWHMESNGFRFPSHHTPSPEESLPGGMRVAAGKYKVVLKTKTAADSIWIEVKDLPHNPESSASIQSRTVLFNRLETSVSRANKAFEALKEAEKSIDLLLSLKYTDDSAVSRITKLAAPVRDSIKAIKYLFMQHAGVQYYEEITVFLNSVLYDAYSYILNNENPGANAVNALNNAEKMTEKVLTRVNVFFEKEWNQFKSQAEKETPKFFKESQKF